MPAAQRYAGAVAQGQLHQLTAAFARVVMRIAQAAQHHVGIGQQRVAGIGVKIQGAGQRDVLADALAHALAEAAFGIVDALDHQGAMQQQQHHITRLRGQRAVQRGQQVGLDYGPRGGIDHAARMRGRAQADGGLHMRVIERGQHAAHPVIAGAKALAHLLAGHIMAAPEVGQADAFGQEGVGFMKQLQDDRVHAAPTARGAGRPVFRSAPLPPARPGSAAPTRPPLAGRCGTRYSGRFPPARSPPGCPRQTAK